MAEQATQEHRELLERFDELTRSVVRHLKGALTALEQVTADGDLKPFVSASRNVHGAIVAVRKFRDGLREHRREHLGSISDRMLKRFDQGIGAMLRHVARAYTEAQDLLTELKSERRAHGLE